MNTFQNRDTRQHILDIAQQIVGKKGFSAVGLNEVLAAAQVPKGSFYHYFSSKDAFGEALLEDYFETYLAHMQQVFQSAMPERHKLFVYWQHWIDNQTACSDAGKCLAVKLGAEVADLSEPMRLALNRGTARIIHCLADAIERGQQQGSLKPEPPPQALASQLYALWLGASVMAKITRTAQPFDEALSMTRLMLNPV
ncbi:MAG: TetR/AcrR family transcriptional regulator [Pseudomonas sp.]|uniref:TetR/AcrR family transcriptional regulator n=1 Tax=Pseudomonas abieticivorans TaxID=2931382 RepID=UPI0020C03079|nr:TetR/AcrR family transcriptional regulator [Pseudomonas sp. PIA16]MDE1165192.1 TetR/AcrR family transcriptional regulator [Pseudomonas sp.]